MGTYKNIMISMDLSESDKALIHFAKSISDESVTERVRGVHVIPHVLPGYVLKAIKPGQELNFIQFFDKIRDKKEDEIRRIFKGSSIRVHMDILEGIAYRSIMEAQEVLHADLLVIGKKGKSTGSGITAKRTARHARIDVAIVPDSYMKRAPDRILVPVDFSDNSARALQKAIAYKQNHNNSCAVIGLHILDVPSPSVFNEYDLYHKVVDKMPDEAQLGFDRFAKKHSIDKNKMRMNYEFLEGTNMGVALLSFAKKKEVDWIMLGAHGHSAIENFVYGSVTESLLDENKDIPIIVIR
jgi:nucleotide-binding universal stress UspA family protein